MVDDSVEDGPPNTQQSDEPVSSADDTPDIGDGPVDDTAPDFTDFGPADMAAMTREEWEAAFDPGTWITGPELLDRVEADLKTRVADRTLFAVIERHEIDGEPTVIAYSDSEYAVVHLDGRVEGEGALLEEIEPVVALCAMDDYTPGTPPDGELLPDPASIEPGSGDLGNRLLQVVASIQVIAGLALLLSPLLLALPGSGTALLTTVIGLAFILIGIVLFVLVANARLSDRFRAQEYRQRLQAAGVGRDERPDFLPIDDDESPG